MVGYLLPHDRGTDCMSYSVDQWECSIFVAFNLFMSSPLWPTWLTVAHLLGARASKLTTALAAARSGTLFYRIGILSENKKRSVKYKYSLSKTLHTTTKKTFTNICFFYVSTWIRWESQFTSNWKKI